MALERTTSAARRHPGFVSGRNLVGSLRMQRHRAFAIAFLAGMLVFRLAIALQFSTSSPDADQYFALAKSILRDGRYAYGPPPAPLTYTRMPGYPLLAAAFDLGPQSREAHARRAAIVNAIFDTMTAAIVVLLLLQLGHGRAAIATAVLGVALFPTGIYWSVHALTESTATLLMAATLCLLVRFAQTGEQRFLVGAAPLVGLACLVRFDSIVLVPPALLAIWLAPDPTKRIRHVALFGAVALLVFSPWPLRNVMQFGAPHIEGTEWLSQRGDPLPSGAIRWMRTWCTNGPNENALPDRIVFGQPFRSDTPGVILPQMYDDEAERKTLVAIVDEVGQRGLTLDINDRFVALAKMRERAHPLRTFVRLPLVRLGSLLAPPPYSVVRWAHIPTQRYWQYPVYYTLVYLLALIGSVALWRRDERRILVLLWTAIATRFALHTFAVPHQVGPRFVVECYPLLVAIGAIGVADAVQRWRARHRPATTDSKVS